jgi:hypothetical protein
MRLEFAACSATQAKAAKKISSPKLKRRINHVYRKYTVNTCFVSLILQDADNRISCGICQAEGFTMTNPVGAPSPVTAPPAPTATKKEDQKATAPANAPAAPAGPSVQVQISPAAQAAQEASETPTQTAQEARGNDNQAKHLLAREQAAVKAYSGG